MAECFLAGEEGWMFSALSGEVATLTLYHHLLILQSLDLSLSSLELLNSV